MLNSVTIRKVASYDDRGIELKDLKKVNFFYGHNGAGKSTIAKYLHNLSLPDNDKNSDFDSCSEVGFDNENHHILVFDDNFTEQNFKQNNTLKGVFSLNQKNKEIDLAIQKEEKIINKYEEYIKSKEKCKNHINEDKAKKEKEVTEFCWQERTHFSTFSKISLNHSKSKSNNLKEIKSRLDAGIPTTPNIESLQEQYQTLYESDIKKVENHINLKLYKNIRTIENKLFTLLNEVIVGNEDVDIAGLIISLNARSWVEDGVAFLNETSNKCPFCQKDTVDEELKEQFNKFFDLTYKEKIKEISDLLIEYKAKINKFIEELMSIQQIYNPESIVSDVLLKIQKLKTGNEKIISEKIKNSNEKKTITSLLTLKEDLSHINKSITDNNNLFSQLDIEKSSLISNIWNFMAERCKDKITEQANKNLKYERIDNLSSKLIQSYKDKIAASKQAIEHLRTKTINTKEAVDSINLILKNAGYSGFEIAEKSVNNNISEYYLKRPNISNNNSVFKSLSEGEKNFISFLYYFQLCIGTDNILDNGSKKKIIVIDDPVSSLDSQALFIVSTLIHQIILRKSSSKPERKEFKNPNISQVFILTHNLYFYKEVSFDRRPLCTHYWHYKVNKVNNITSIEGSNNRPVYDDYSLLWKAVKDIKKNLPSDTSMNISIANSMRRIIESYVNFLGLGKDAWSSVLNDNTSNPEYYIKCAFISIINDESHKTAALDSVYYQKIITEQPQILFDVFEEIFKSIGKEHYEMMMGS